MSDLWAPPSLDNAFDAAERVPVWTRPVARRFSAAPTGTPAGFSAWATDVEQTEDIVAPATSAPLDLDLLQSEAFAQGFEEGRRLAEVELADERAAMARLAEGLEALHPEAPADLATLLNETVRRLVTQIVGAVEIDATALAERVGAVAALVVEDAAPARLRLHPDDIARLGDARLPVALVPDATLAPATILLETAGGWIEDGPALRMDRLRQALDAMGCPR